MEDLKIIYKHGRPYGIRDGGGFLFFFCRVNKYAGQEERYRREIEEQYRLADNLLNFLKSRIPAREALGSGVPVAQFPPSSWDDLGQTKP